MSFTFAFYQEGGEAQERMDDEDPSKKKDDRLGESKIVAIEASPRDSRTIPIVHYVSMLATEVDAGIMDVPKDTDLLPGVYEGGLKLWESSIDLVRFMHQRQGYISLNSGIDVLELGCGHGLPGIYALAKGAHVCLMDLNEEVLSQVTAHNISLNVRSADVHDRVMLISGDWEGASEVLRQAWKGGSHGGSEQPADGWPKFDLVLTAETTYTLMVTDKMLSMLSRHLKPGSGLALVAGKRYYFGTGGSVASLLEKAQAMGFEASVVESIEDGKSNIRDIVSIKWCSR